MTTNHSTKVISNDFYISIPKDCKNELLRLNITKNKNTDRNLVYFQVFSDSVHQAELERYQGHIKLDEKYPYNGAHGRLTYDIHNKHWIPHIGINDPSNCKADTKNKGYQEIMFFRLENTTRKNTTHTRFIRQHNDLPRN